MIWQVTAPHFCAGVVVKGGKCVTAAPILSWAIGKDARYLLRYFSSKGWVKEDVMDGTTVVTQEQDELPKTPALPAGYTISSLIHKYIQLRDKMKEIEDVHKKYLEPYANVMAQVEGLLMNALNQAGVDSMKADTGTVFKSTQTSVSVSRWQETFAFIREHELWDLFEARVNKTAAIAVIQETGKPIPGVKVTQAEVLRVRRS